MGPRRISPLRGIARKWFELRLRDPQSRVIDQATLRPRIWYIFVLQCFKKAFLKNGPPKGRYWVNSPLFSVLGDVLMCTKSLFSPLLIVFCFKPKRQLKIFNNTTPNNIKIKLTINKTLDVTGVKLFIKIILMVNNTTREIVISPIEISFFLNTAKLSWLTSILSHSSTWILFPDLLY